MREKNSEKSAVGLEDGGRRGGEKGWGGGAGRCGEEGRVEGVGRRCGTCVE